MFFRILSVEQIELCRGGKASDQIGLIAGLVEQRVSLQSERSSELYLIVIVTFDDDIADNFFGGLTIAHVNQISKDQSDVPLRTQRFFQNLNHQKVSCRD